MLQKTSHNHSTMLHCSLTVFFLQIFFQVVKWSRARARARAKVTPNVDHLKIRKFHFPLKLGNFVLVKQFNP